MTIVLLGPITEKSDYNVTAYTSAAAALVTAGYTVVNPLDQFPADYTHPWSDYVSTLTNDIQSCNAILALKDWDTSAYAKALVNLGISLAKPVIGDNGLGIVQVLNAIIASNPYLTQAF